MNEHVASLSDHESRMAQAAFLITLVRNHIGEITYKHGETGFRVFAHEHIPPEVDISLRALEMDILVLLDLETKGKNFSHPMDLL